MDLSAQLDDLARRQTRPRRHRRRCHFGFRDLVIASDHPDGLDVLTAALAAAPESDRPVLRLTEVDPDEVGFFDAVPASMVGSYGVVRSLIGGPWAAAWHPERRQLLAYHPASGVALFARGHAIPPREIAEIHRTLLHWAAVAEGNAAIHAAGVADGVNAVIVTGPGNAGKTTFVRACALAGLEFLGDNIVEVANPAGSPSVHGVYLSMKVRRPARFLDPGSWPDPLWDDEAQKDIYFLRDRAGPRWSEPKQLQALVSVSADAPPLMCPSRSAASLFAIGPNTIAQYPLFEQELFRSCGALVRAVPTFTVGHLGSVEAHRHALDALFDVVSSRRAIP